MTIKTRIPEGWVKTGAREKDYIVGTIEGISHTGCRCGYIESNTTANSAFATLMQGIRAEMYKGGRLRLTSWIKTEEVSGWAGMWLRVDGDKKRNKRSLEFDNMHDRTITGTTNWTKYDIELPVPSNARAIALGVMLCGAGKVFCDDFQLEFEPSSNIEDIDQEPEADYDFYVNECPLNLNFED